MDKNSLLKLKNVLQNSDELPGPKAWRKMVPESHPISTRKLSDIDVKKLTPASVLLALFFEEGHDWRFPLIQRVEDNFPHSGQIALPGGRNEKGEKTTDAAIREAHEETGIVPESVEIYGKLTPLPIPSSGYYVFPVVGILNKIPNFVAQESEIASIFTIGLNELIHPKARLEEIRKIDGKKYNIPFFYFHGHKVWGATAMILSEFASLIKGL